MAIQLSRIDHHKVLGVHPSASPAEIEDAYANLSAQFRDQPWQFERSRSIDRAYQALTGTRPARLPVPDRDPAPLIARGQTEDEPVHSGPAPDAWRDDEQPSPPIAAAALPQERAETQDWPETYDWAEPRDRVEPQDRAGLQDQAEVDRRPRWDEEPVDAHDTDDERSGRRAFYAIGALTLAGVLGTLLYPIVQGGSSAPEEQVATRSTADPQVGPDAASGLPAVVSTEQLNGAATAGTVQSEVPVDTRTEPGVSNDNAVQTSLSEVLESIAPPVIAQREEEPAPRPPADEPPPANRDEDRPPPARPAEDEPVDQAETRPPPPAPAPVRATPAPSRAARAQWVRGGLIDSDNQGGQFNGAVTVRLSISPVGRVSGCQVARSSGNRALDSTTCRLLSDRLEFVPARSAAGTRMASEVTSTHVWSRVRRR